jgi:hypothetical protein
MRPAENHLVPVAEAEDSLEQEVAGTRKQVEPGKDPQKVANVRTISRNPRAQQRTGSDDKIHERSTGVDPTIRPQR